MRYNPTDQFYCTARRVWVNMQVYRTRSCVCVCMCVRLCESAYSSIIRVYKFFLEIVPVLETVYIPLSLLSKQCACEDFPTLNRYAYTSLVLAATIWSVVSWYVRSVEGATR